MFWLNPYVLSGLGLAALISLGGAYWYGYSSGSEIATLRCEKRVQVIKDGIAEANAAIRQEEARKQRELERLLEARVEEAIRFAEQEREAQQRIRAYEEALESSDACLLNERDLDSLR